MGRAGLALTAVVIRASIALTTSLSAGLETLQQKVESRRAAAALLAVRNAKATNRWRAAFEAAPLGMAKVSPEGRLEEVNSAVCNLLGEPERALLGRRLSALVYPDDLGQLSGPGHPGRGNGVAKTEVRLVCAGGQLRWCELASSVVRDTDDHPAHVLVYVVDITRHKRSQAALRDLATRDPLSGLANRRWFELQLAQHLRLCANEGPRGALIVIDLDNFKTVNDTFGHQAGDRLVIEVAVTLRRHLRDKDLVARLGGDEFAVVLRDGDRRAAEAVARKLVLAVRDEVTTAGSVAGPGGGGREPAPVVGEVTVSIGVAPFDLLPGAGAREALRAADAAMYAVKRSGRNGYAIVGSEERPRHARARPAGSAGSYPDAPGTSGCPETRVTRRVPGGAAARTPDLSAAASAAGQHAAYVNGSAGR